MVIKIDERDLNNILLRHSDVIEGKEWWDSLALCFGGVFDAVSVLFTPLGVLGKAILVSLGLLFVFRGVYLLLRDRKDPLSCESLVDEIKSMNRIEIKSTLIAVLDDSPSSRPRRILLYHDDGWGCDFLPNHRSMQSIDDDKSDLVRMMECDYGLSLNPSDISFVAERDSEKQSTEHNGQLRYYHYRLYSARLCNMPLGWDSDRFTANGVRSCRWMTVDEMFSNARISDVNHDVISMLRDEL